MAMASQCCPHHHTVLREGRAHVVDGGEQRRAHVREVDHLALALARHGDRDVLDAWPEAALGLVLAEVHEAALEQERELRLGAHTCTAARREAIAVAARATLSP